MKIFLLVFLVIIVFLSGCISQPTETKSQSTSDIKPSPTKTSIESPSPAPTKMQTTASKPSPSPSPSPSLSPSPKPSPTKVEIGPLKFVKKDFIDLDRIEKISKFRGGYAHDFSYGTGEECRSMKHYYWAKGGEPGRQHSIPWTTIKYYSPVDGTMGSMRTGIDSDGETEYYFTIVSSEYPDYRFRFFHVNLLPEFANGGIVKAGQHIGYLPDEYAHGEIAIEVGSLYSYGLVSFFDVMSDELFEQYKKRGMTAIEDAKITKQQRDSKLLVCDYNTPDGRFIGRQGISESSEEFRQFQSGPENWVILS